MDAAYRIATLVIFAGAMSIGVYHRWRAHSGEKFDRRQEGLPLAIALRLAGVVLWVGAILFLVWPPAIAFAQVELPDWLRWLGVVPGVAGIGLMYWTLTNLGKNLTDTVATRAEATLVTSGPYRYVRHPFYLTAALLMLAVALLSANWLIAAAGAAVIALLVLRTAREEQKLVEKFGDAYRQYMARTGRFLPWIGG
jgi:protein-S-isoprenylcysteine O-methyltransferase Ste14